MLSSLMKLMFCEFYFVLVRNILLLFRLGFTMFESACQNNGFVNCASFLQGIIGLFSRLHIRLHFRLQIDVVPKAKS